MKTNKSTSSESIEELSPLDPTSEKEISERIKFTWVEFNKMSHLLITLSTGTIVLFGNFTLKNDTLIRLNGMSYNSKWLAVIPIILLVLGLISAVAWRFYSQIGMEREVLGDRRRVKQYLDSTGMNEHFTKFVWSEAKVIKKFVLFHSLALIFLFAGWITLGVFFILNILLK